MRSTFRVLFYTKNQSIKNGKVPVMGRITINKTTACFSCKKEVSISLWDAKANRAKGKSEEARMLNQELDNAKAQIAKHYQYICDHDSFVTAKKVYSRYVGFKEDSHTLMELFREQLESYKEKVGKEKAKSTYLGLVADYKSALLFLKDKKNELRYDNVEVNDEIEEKPVYHTISAPVGGEYHFTLADGTMVWLNSSSRLTFPTRFTGDMREVLAEGEVYFDVRHDENKPFIVRVNDVSVRVLGTKFCISAYPENEGILTTLEQGAVQVTSGDNYAVLKPGYQAVVDQYSGTISQRAVELSLYTSWVRGIFEYENMELDDIVVQLARWYDVQFTFSASEYKKRRFTGVVRKYEDLNGVLDMIEKTTNVKFIINGRNVTITSVMQ